jgi:TonB family protein|tara:strand:+ start:2809 stop:3435 length:627 start_codon:yes stop_codon:yes gene_type:complete
MKVNKVYLEASFVSFMIHASIILYSLGFFYYESNQRSVLSKPINVNLIFQEEVQKKVQSPQPQKKVIEASAVEEVKFQNEEVKNTISFDSLITSISVEELLEEEILNSQTSEQNQVELFSSLIIQSLQSAWRKPMNIQNGLICDIRLTINKNGRVVNSNLIKSSGNIRFDNSALMAVERIETFNFFNRIPTNIYQSNFRNIVITFNPS